MHEAQEFLRSLHVRAHIPGCEQLDGDALATLWFTLESQGLAHALFYDGAIRCSSDFATFMRCADVYCYVVYDGHGIPVALTWLNNFAGRAAMIHFAVFSAGRAWKTAIGKYVVHFLLHGRSDGGYCIDALYGMTPKPYAHVLRFIRRLGFSVQGTIPGAVRMEQSGGGVRHVDGLISVCTRKSLVSVC